MKKRFKRPDLQDVIEYFMSKGQDPELAKQAYEYYEIGEWHDSRGNPVRNWKQKMMVNWMKNPLNNRRKVTQDHRGLQSALQFGRVTFKS